MSVRCQKRQLDHQRFAHLRRQADDMCAETKVYWKSPDGNARTTIIPGKGVRWLAAALDAIALALAVLISPQHPDDCHPEKKSLTQQGVTMTQTISPTTFNPMSLC